MELRSILTADPLDIIFDGRNKNYGAYELRRNYSNRATRATFTVLASVLLLLGGHAFASRFKSTEKIDMPITNKPIDVTPIKLPDEPIVPPPPQPVAPPPPAAPTVDFRVPTIAPDVDVVDPPATVDDLAGKQPGTETTDGDPNALGPATSTETGTGPATSIVEAPKVMDEIVTYVEQMPEFNGDVNKYLANNIQYPQMARDAGTKGKVVIRFVVNEDGSVTDPKVIKGIGAGCEEEAIRVIKSMPKWKPGKQNGKAVKVYFTLPINFVLG